MSAKAMNRKTARAEARRVAEATDECTVIYISQPSRRYKRYALMSRSDLVAIGGECPVVGYVWPGGW